MTKYPDNMFFRVDNGDSNVELCGECINDWIQKTNTGKYAGDEAFDKSYILGKAETPVQCEGCNKQSDDYDSVLDQ